MPLNNQRFDLADQLQRWRHARLVCCKLNSAIKLGVSSVPSVLPELLLTTIDAHTSFFAAFQRHPKTLVMPLVLGAHCTKNLPARGPRIVASHNLANDGSIGKRENQSLVVCGVLN